MLMTIGEERIHLKNEPEEKIGGTLVVIGIIITVILSIIF